MLFACCSFEYSRFLAVLLGAGPSRVSCIACCIIRHGHNLADRLQCNSCHVKALYTLESSSAAGRPLVLIGTDASIASTCALDKKSCTYF
ncbi:hypothetical protein F5Y01DRAFT_33714 [Xylaria sp. FL0043]|nr:hypothetical protein F5Y01DRAFT_33714 [Xylaria sp. FL0043]